MRDLDGPCPRCEHDSWEPLSFPTADGRTHRCAYCWLMAPGWCPDCLDTAHKGWIADKATNTARWCEGCGGPRGFQWGKKKDGDEDPERDTDARTARVGGWKDRRKDMGRLEDGSWPARWTKIRKRNDEWGAFALSAKVEVGDNLSIQRAGESTIEVHTIAEIIFKGDGIALCVLEKDGGSW